jgi:uncharacterized membrane protein
MNDTPEETDKNIVPQTSDSIQKKLEELIPEKEKREQVKTLCFEYRKFFSGPLPAPECLAEYNNILPGLADRIVVMAETQSSHRIKMEEKVVDRQLSESARGQLFGLIIGLFALGVAGTLGLFGQPIAAAIIGTVDMVGLVSIFLVGKKQQSRSLEKKST